MGLFLTAGLGSGSTYQMIAVIFRQITQQRMLAAGHSAEEAQHTAVTRAPEPAAEQPAPTPAPAPAPAPAPKPASTGGLRIPRFLGRQSNQ